MDFIVADPVALFINSLFGMSDSPAPLRPLLTSYNQVIAAIAGIVVFYELTTFILKTAGSGKVASNSVAIIRCMIAMALIIPTPSGLTAGQYAFGSALNLSVEGAKTLYAQAENLVKKQGRPLTMPNDPQAYSLALDISALLICNEMILQRYQHQDDFFKSLGSTNQHDSDMTFQLVKEVSEGSISYLNVRKGTNYQGVKYADRGYCGAITVAASGEGAAHEAAFSSRTQAIEQIAKASVPILDNKFRAVFANDTGALMNAAVDAIAKMQETAFAILVKNHTEQSAAAWAAVNKSGGEWRGSFADIGADIYALHKSQIDVMRASMPGAVTVERVDLRENLWKMATIKHDFILEFERAMRGKFDRALFATEADAAASGRPGGATWLGSINKMFKGAILGVAGVQDFAAGAKELGEAAKASFLKSTKTMFLNVLRQPWAEVAASPFGAVAALGAPLLEIGRYMTGAGAVASFVPGLGNLGMLGLVAGFGLMFLGGFCAYVMPLFPAILWISIVATIFVGAFVSLIIIPLIALRMLNFDAETILDRGEAWKPVIYYASLPALAALGLLSFSFIYGAIIATGNAALLRAIGNESSGLGADGFAWLWWAATYIFVVVVGGMIAAFKATWGLADYAAKALSINVPNHASDDGARLGAVGYMQSKTIVQRTSGGAAQTASGIAKAAGSAITASGGGQGGGGGGSVAAGLRNARNNSQSASDQQIDVGKYVSVKNMGDK